MDNQSRAAADRDQLSPGDHDTLNTSVDVPDSARDLVCGMTAFDSREAGIVFDGDRRFNVVVRLPYAQRDDIDTLGSIPVTMSAVEGQTARSIPLRKVVRFRYTGG